LRGDDFLGKTISYVTVATEVSMQNLDCDTGSGLVVSLIDNALTTFTQPSSQPELAHLLRIPRNKPFAHDTPFLSVISDECLTLLAIPARYRNIGCDMMALGSWHLAATDGVAHQGRLVTPLLCRFAINIQFAKVLCPRTASPGEMRTASRPEVGRYDHATALSVSVVRRSLSRQLGPLIEMTSQ
jgi:hypothetical protein